MTRHSLWPMCLTSCSRPEPCVCVCAACRVRHRTKGETLLLQLDVAAASSGSSIVATLSGRQGGFAPYRIDNCSAVVLHVQQAGCEDQEDVLQPYSSLPYAWDEPSLPHKVRCSCVCVCVLPGCLGVVSAASAGQPCLTVDLYDAGVLSF